ncbi:MAG: hotdog domain-containing protein [Marmoricola sp.]
MRTAAGVEVIHHFSEAQVGAPGIAHGGAVAMAFDDLFGFALDTVGSLAVTRSLTIEYQAPFILHHPYTFRAEVAD